MKTLWIIALCFHLVTDKQLYDIYDTERFISDTAGDSIIKPASAGFLLCI